MEPTLLPGDIVLCSRCVKLNGINQNDIVIFRSPDDDSTLLVKRVYDINKVVSGKIYYDMRGDNKENSCDSRYFGLIPMNKLEGKVKLIIASWDGERHFFRMNRFWKGV